MNNGKAMLGCAQRVQTPPRPLHCRGEEQWRPLVSDNISYEAVSHNIKVSGKVIYIHIWIQINTKI